MVTTMQRESATERGTTSSLIASDRVEGTAVYDAQGKRIGKVERLMIDKLTGQIAYDIEVRRLPRHRRGSLSASLVSPDL